VTKTYAREPVPCNASRSPPVLTTVTWKRKQVQLSPRVLPARLGRDELTSCRYCNRQRHSTLVAAKAVAPTSLPPKVSATPRQHGGRSALSGYELGDLRGAASAPPAQQTSATGAGVRSVRRAGDLTPGRVTRPSFTARDPCVITCRRPARALPQRH